MVEDRFKSIDDIHDLAAKLPEVTNPKELSYLLKRLTKRGNSKLANYILVFNMGTAKNCPNMGTERCQASEGDDCYASRAETRYPHTTPQYRDKQQLLWDSVTGEMFAYAILEILERSRNDIEYLRFNESGDFRHKADMERAETVARILKEEADITAYTYTASSFLDFSDMEYLTVNASNPDVEGADNYFNVVSERNDTPVSEFDELPEDSIPKGAFECPGECGPCRACMHKGGSDMIYEELRV